MNQYKGVLSIFILAALSLSACQPVKPVEEAVSVVEDTATEIVCPNSAVIYVDSSASGADDGSSWTNAYTSLQDALSGADGNSQVWVAAGTYRPTEAADRSASFQLRDCVAVYGGFAGTETSIAERDWQTHITLLSGDLQGDDGADFANYTDNSNNVVVGSGTDNSAILDGFTVTGGNASLSADAERVQPCTEGCGGGMYNESGSPTLSNVIFSGNRARYGGGGLQNVSQSNPTLTHVTFSGNSARYGGGMANFGDSSPTLTGVTFSENTARDEGRGTGGGGGMFNDHSNPALTNVTLADNIARAGGGIFNYKGSHPTLDNVTFSANTARSSGGGMFNYMESSPTLTNVTFADNTANSGGGMLNSDSDPTLANVTFSGNRASSNGGGMFNVASNPTLTNVSFTDNTAPEGGGMYNAGSSPIIQNSILWGNSADIGPEIYNVASTPTIAHSLVQRSGGSGNSWDQSLGTDGGDNLDDNPLFEDADNGGLNLQSDSPSIDAGQNQYVPEEVSTDLDGNPRIMGSAVDMGAYEF